MIFSFCWWFSLLCKNLKAWLGPVCLLLLLFLLPCETDLRKHCYYLWQRMAYLCFILGILLVSCLISGFPGGSDGKASACNAGSPDSIPGSGRSPGEGNGYPLQQSCLENPLSHFEFIFMYCVRECSNFIDLHAGFFFLYLPFLYQVLPLFSTVSSVLAIVLWNIFIMATLKSLSDNSNISVIFVLVSIDYFLFQVEVFLFLSMMSHFQYVQDILGYHARKL